MKNYIEAIEHLLSLAKAEKAGATIQYRINAGYPWTDLTKTLDQIPTHVLDDHGQYRIKPEPKVRPWTRDEVPVGAVIKNSAGHRMVIGYATSNEDVGVVGRCGVSTAYLLQYFTLADGSPCGVTE